MLKPNMSLPRSCKWFEVKARRYPACFRKMAARAMAAMPDTHHEANTYQPNMVLNQCVSTDITQSQADIDDVTAYNTRNKAEALMLRWNHTVPPNWSSDSES